MRASAPWWKEPGQRFLTATRRFTNSTPKAIAFDEIVILQIRDGKVVKQH